MMLLNEPMSMSSARLHTRKDIRHSHQEAPVVMKTVELSCLPLNSTNYERTEFPQPGVINVPRRAASQDKNLELRGYTARQRRAATQSQQSSLARVVPSQRLFWPFLDRAR